MPKNVLHDIMTRESRSIRQVPLPHKRRGAPEQEEATPDPEAILYEREEVTVTAEKPSSWRRGVLWGAAGLFLFLLLLAVSASMSGATITVTPRVLRLSLAQEFTATRATGETRSASAALRFEALPIENTAELVLPADTRKKVAERASGTIVVYNAFSKNPQRLIKNTRFETPEGLVYRVGSSIIVPGKTERDGRAIPGSIEASVTADAPGAEYNIALSDFTVPGFKNDAARFAGFYARSKTPMAGGFEGTVVTPSEDARKRAETELRATLARGLSEKAEALVPSGYVLFGEARAVRYEMLPIEERPRGMAAVRARATGALYLFREEDITRAIANASLKGAAPAGPVSAPLEIPDLSLLAFSFMDRPSGDPLSATSIRFTLTGAVRAVSLFDEEKLKSALVGKPRSELAATLSAFPAIEKAELVLRPFWSRTFPDNPKRVNVERASLPEQAMTHDKQM